MQKPKGFDEASREAYRSVKPGGYVCNILNAEETVAAKSGRAMLNVSVDIAEGELKGYYRDQYKRIVKTNPDAKWGCIARTMVETKEGNTDPSFKNFVECLKESNPTYEPAWGDNFCDGLKGKKIGIVFFKEEYMGRDGNTHWSVKPDFGHFKSVSDIKNGKYTVPEDKPLKDDLRENKANSDYAIPDGFEVISEEDVPF